MIRRAVPLAGLALALAACGAGPQTQQAPASAAPVALDLKTSTAAAAKGLDKVTWNLPYEPQTLDPIRSFNYAENTALANMCESLLRLTPDFTIEPGLAEKADNPTPTTWVYTIREGVTFWDGKPLTAQDVAASLKRHLDPALGTWWSDYFSTVEKVEATGPMQVTVTLKQADVLFNQAMATAAGAIVSKEYAAKKDLGSPTGGLMCTGPFEFGAWKSGDSLSIVRNDAYWDKALTAKSKEIVFRFIADETTAVNALRSGEVDGQYFYLPPAGLAQLRESTTGSVTLGKSLTFWTLLSAAKDGPYADPKVRQALSLALDRAAISKVVFQGTAAPQRTLAGAEYWGYERATFEKAYQALPQETQDLAKAKQLLTEAGSPTEPITIAIQGSAATHEQTANLIKATGEALGLKIDIKVVPVEQYGNLYSDPKAREGVDAFFSTWYGNVPDPLDIYTVFQAGGRTNFNGYPAVDADIKKARAEADPAARAALVTGIQDKVTRDVAWMPLNNLPVILYMSDRVTGAVPSFPYLYYPWAVGLGAK
ncbi:ABC transporter substrate-binding protein [Nonomuraea dietziae]|jgi:peptide/nickel transport system substrate-binding protein|uniref:Peptide/nickel transport system substrate-binding protein n=1 Tax=Nonomuraea dietziae TaxID=65515 RepID=A0A7W5V7G2_9ACTN|nr:ABC transporter substrate-binding protein [Nonomuraea dietziae]MBB3726859.1 peptide/nickel transport system substrate-binding protein [Nonomuraea dietziae]